MRDEEISIETMQIMSRNQIFKLIDALPVYNRNKIKRALVRMRWQGTLPWWMALPFMGNNLPPLRRRKAIALASLKSEETRDRILNLTLLLRKPYTGLETVTVRFLILRPRREAEASAESTDQPDFAQPGQTRF